MKSIFKGLSVLLILISGIMITRYITDLYQNNRVLQEASQLRTEESRIIEDQNKQTDGDLEEAINDTKLVDYDTVSWELNTNQSLLEQNRDFIGWIQVEGTVIDYPVVKTNNNDFYLDHDFNKNKNIAGSIYMDYRNVGNDFDDHILIYGHNMKNGSMFHNLRYFKDREFFEENTSIVFSNLYETNEYQIFSVYPVSAEDYRFEVSFDEVSVSEYIQILKGRSLHQKDIMFDDDSQILTLTTCTYEVSDGRFIVHAIKVD